MFLQLLVFAAQSSALNFTSPKSFGGKTKYSDYGWRTLIHSLSTEIEFGDPPTTQIPITNEPTCFTHFSKCSTTYFGKDLYLHDPKTAQLWVKWYQDATPFACDAAEGCTISSSTSVSDLTSQSKGWRVTASLNAKIGIENDIPSLKADANTSLSVRYSNSESISTTITSTKTLSSKCDKGNLCFLQTGTLMMALSGFCYSNPLIHCDKNHYPCENFDYYSSTCSQWSDFTRKYCKPELPVKEVEKCSFNVAVRGPDSNPVSFQVFEQKPIDFSKFLKKREFVSAQKPFGELPDGSSGAWMAWSP